jgi:hypothetical protein
MKRVTVLSLVLGLAMLGGGNAASAATFGPVTTAVDSRDGAFMDQNVSEADLNTGTGFFGTNDWSEITKIETNPNDDSYSDQYLTISNGVRNADGDLVSGDWSILSSLWQTYNAIALVLKDGNKNGIFYTAWLLQEGTSSGSWKMPDKNLSHMTIYGSQTDLAADNPPAVPVPAAVWLFGSGLLGLLGAARKKSAAA